VFRVLLQTTVRPLRDTDTPPGRLLAESLTVAVVAFGWAVASWLGAISAVGTTIRRVGVVLVVAVAVVRGVRLAGQVDVPTVATPVELLQWNLAVVPAVGAWLLVAVAVDVLASGLQFRSLDALVFAATTTAVATAGLYAVASVTTTVRRETQSD
jgi:hypothetical protein